jgi:hypothetical protein
MVPYIGYRAETRGAYGEWKTNQVRRISALDPATLTSEQVDTLLDAYEEVRNREWDLLRNQMDDVQSDEDHERRVLDEKVAEALFVNDEENDGETDVEEEVDFDSLYEDFNNTLTKLGELMD